MNNVKELLAASLEALETTDDILKAKKFGDIVQHLRRMHRGSTVRALRRSLRAVIDVTPDTEERLGVLHIDRVLSAEQRASFKEALRESLKGTGIKPLVFEKGITFQVLPESTLILQLVEALLASDNHHREYDDHGTYEDSELQCQIQMALNATYRSPIPQAPGEFVVRGELCGKASKQEGWACNGPKGHTGPCAAWPIPQVHSDFKCGFTIADGTRCMRREGHSGECNNGKAGFFSRLFGLK